MFLKYKQVLLALFLVACNAADESKETETKTDTLITTDSEVHKQDSTVQNDTTVTKKVPPEPAPSNKVYSNQRFKEVTIEKTGEHRFLIKGKGQIFEASFNWVVEDGHEELKKGYEMTDAGAPEWGNFSFTVEVAKKRPNSTLHLILFETSAKDGSRQYELPIMLY